MVRPRGGMLGRVQVRSGQMQPPGGHDPVPTRELSWRVARGPSVLKWVGAGLFAVIAAGIVLTGGDPFAAALSGVAGIVLGLHALRDVLVPVRLAADPHGLVVVSGYAGRRRIPWAAVERIHVDERTRFGARSRLLEIDTGENLHLFSAAELGAPCDEVAGALAALRTGA
jgi:Bacterial PH domain